MTTLGWIGLILLILVIITGGIIKVHTKKLLKDMDGVGDTVSLVEQNNEHV